MFEDLIIIAQSDLKASRILYENKQYRNSYYLFQQASEKANKAFGLTMDIVQLEDLRKKIGHDHLKIHQKAFNKQREGIKESYSKMKDAGYMGKLSNVSEIDQTLSSLLFMDEYLETAKRDDVTKFSLKYLNELLDTLNGLKNLKISISELNIADLRKEILKISEWVNAFSDQEVQPEVQYFFRMFEDEVQFAEFRENALEPGLQFLLDFVFVMMTLLFCGTITAGQNDQTRYPNEKFMPEGFYRLSLPIVRKQPEFMGMLELAIKRMKKLHEYDVGVL